MPSSRERLLAPLATAGLLLGTLFVAFSLTPSLLPRTWSMQGVLSGLSFAAGYGIGVHARWLWRYLELPAPGTTLRRVSLLLTAPLCAGVAIAFLWRAADWQNAVRALMALPPVDSAHPLRVGVIALLVFLLVLGIARLFHVTLRAVSMRLRRFIPRRLATVIGAGVATALFWTVANGVLIDFALRASDRSYQEVDALLEPDTQPPPDSLRTGSPRSLIEWATLGRQGRRFVSGGPTRDDLRAFADEPVREPIRVYVGLNSAPSIEDRAQLALDELMRVGAFGRSVLVIATPTGTGWLDPAAIGTLEYLHRGDVATVAVQYSYLPSWLSLLAEPEYGAATAQAVFAKVYDHWTRLARDARPRLYVHGVSLGALNSERAADIFDVITDPFDGALWVGPPFRSENWRLVTERREPDSPAWRPRFRDGRIVRFTNHGGALDRPDTPWGPIRIAYLQYASDPVTFFDPRIAYRRPDWMQPPLGPGVTPLLRWFPVVTMLQLAIDFVAGDSAPRGFGHVYAPSHYLDAWLALSAPEGWSAERIARLRMHVEATL